MRTSVYLALGILGLAVAVGPDAKAALVIFSGIDAGANSTDPRPLSDAAAASFDLAASVLGSTSIITFEGAPLGQFANLTVAPGVNITGSNVAGGNQTIVNAPVGSPDSLFGYNTTAGGSEFVSLQGGTLTFTFATPISAFGSYLSGVQLAYST